MMPRMKKRRLQGENLEDDAGEACRKATDQWLTALLPMFVVLFLFVFAPVSVSPPRPPV